MAAPAVTPPGARHSCEFKYRINVESASNNYLQNYLTTNYYNQKLFAILGGLESGGLNSGGLKSGGLMSGGLKSAHRYNWQGPPYRPTGQYANATMAERGLEWVVESTTVTHSSADWWDPLLPLA